LYHSVKQVLIKPEAEIYVGEWVGVNFLTCTLRGSPNTTEWAI